MASAAPAAGTTPPPPIARFYQNTDNKDAAGLPVFNWSMVRAVPFGKQKQASTNGYEGYPIMPNVLGDRENTFFGVDDGGGALRLSACIDNQNYRQAKCGGSVGGRA